MAFYHGVKTSEVPTSLLSPAQVDSAITIAWGTAPIHLAADPAKANEPVLCWYLSDYTKKFGETNNFSDYTLAEVAKSQFQLFGVSPTIFINVLDEEKHFNKVEKDFAANVLNPLEIDSEIFLNSIEISSSGEINFDLVQDENFSVDIDTGTSVTTITLTDAPAADKIKIKYTLGETENEVEKSFSDFPAEIIGEASEIKLSASKSVTNNLKVGEDFAAYYNKNNKCEITFLDDTKIFDELVKISYHEAAPEKVTSEDIIGSVDADGNAKGLELIEDIFKKFRLIPCILIAPKFSTDPKVAAVMKAKTENINGVFKAVAIADLPTSVDYSEIAAWKNSKNLVDKNLIVCWPKVSLGGEEFYLSTQLAGLMARTDNDNGDGIPYFSPSNKNLQCDSSVFEGGQEKLLSLTQANYLNANGIVTALNFTQGWVAWGNRTSIFDSSTDVKDVFIPVRRMFQWLSNTVVTTYFQRVDFPLNKRLLDTITDSINIFLNGLTAKGALLGGRCEVLGTENPTTDLMAGIIRFHLYVTPCAPAEDIEFILEYDTNYISDLVV